MRPEQRPEYKASLIQQKADEIYRQAGVTKEAIAFFLEQEKDSEYIRSLLAGTALKSMES